MHSTSEAKSGAADAHILVEIVRLDRAHHHWALTTALWRRRASSPPDPIKSLVWDRTRQTLHLRSALPEFFPVALKAFDELDAPDSLQLNRLGEYPNTAARLTRRQLVGALAEAQPRAPQAGADRIQATLRADRREETNTASRAS